MPARYWIILVAVGAAFGMSFAFNEVLLATWGPMTVSALRLALGATGAWAWVAATGRRSGVARGLVPALAVFGVFQYALPFALLPLAQMHVTSSVAGIANAMTPVAVVVISHLWPGGERATAARLAGVALGLAGIVALAGGAGLGGSDPRFVMVAVGAPVSYGIALNLVRRFRGLDPVVMTAWAMTAAALAIGPAALAAEGVPAVPGPGALAALACIGFGLTSATFIVMYTILPKVGATNLSLVTFVAPLSATLIGATALGEPIGAGHLWGMALILGGLACIDGRLLQHLPRPRRPARP